MARNIEQVFLTQPATEFLPDDLLYLGRFPYGLSNDRAILWENAISMGRTIEVNPETGSDSNGRGSILLPFASLTQAYVIAATLFPSASEPVIIKCCGTLNETTINPIPYVFVIGTGQDSNIINITNPLSLGTGFGGFSTKFGFSNLKLICNVNFNISALAVGTEISAIFDNVNLSCTTINLVGNATNIASVYLKNNCDIDASGAITITNATLRGDGSTQLGHSTLVLSSTVSSSSSALILNSCTVSEMITVSNVSSSTCDILLIACNCQGSSLILNGNSSGISYNYDAISYIEPVIGSGAPVINPLTISNAIDSNYVPLHYNAGDGSVHDALEGIDNVLDTIPSITAIEKRWYVASSGNDSNSGDSTASPFLTIFKANSVSVLGDCIILLDDIIETSVNLLPRIYSGEGFPTLTCDNVNLDPSFSGANNFLVIYGINITSLSQMNWDMTGYNTSFTQNINIIGSTITCAAGWLVKGLVVPPSTFISRSFLHLQNVNTHNPNTNGASLCDIVLNTGIKVTAENCNLGKVELHCDINNASTLFISYISDIQGNVSNDGLVLYSALATFTGANVVAKLYSTNQNINPKLITLIQSGGNGNQVLLNQDAASYRTAIVTGTGTPGVDYFSDNSLGNPDAINFNGNNNLSLYLPDNFTVYPDPIQNSPSLTQYIKGLDVSLLKTITDVYFSSYGDDTSLTVRAETNPAQSFGYLSSQITDSSIFKVYNAYRRGDVAEPVTVEVNPWINILGDGAKWELSSNIIAGPRWNDMGADLSILIDNHILTSPDPFVLILDFSSLPAANYRINLSRLKTFAKSISIVGQAGIEVDIFDVDQSLSSISAGASELTILNCNARIRQVVCNLIQIGTTDGQNYNVTLEGYTAYSQVTVLATGGGTINAVLEKGNNSAITISGVDATVRVDVESWGAYTLVDSAEKPILISLADGLNANYPTPNNYNISGISVADQFPGIDTALSNTPAIAGMDGELLQGVTAGRPVFSGNPTVSGSFEVGTSLVLISPGTGTGNILIRDNTDAVKEIVLTNGEVLAGVTGSPTVPTTFAGAGGITTGYVSGTWTITADDVLSLPPLNYMYGFTLVNGVTPVQLQVSSNTSMVLMSASNDSQIIPTATSLVVDNTVSGNGGLDTGTVAANTLYYIFVTWDSTGTNPNDMIMSLSQTPNQTGTGRDKFRCIGSCKTKVASTNFVNKLQSAIQTYRYYDYLDTLTEARILNNGNATTLTAINLLPFTSSLSSRGVLSYIYTPFAVNGFFAITNHNNGNLIRNVQVTAAGQVSGTIPYVTNIINEQIDYLVANALDTLTLYVASYEEQL